MNRKNLLKLLLGLMLLTGLYLISEPQKILENIRRADTGLYLSSVAVFLLTYIPATIRWKNLSQSIGHDLSVTESFRIVSISYSFNKMFPGNSGDLVRSKIFQRYQDIDNHGEILGIVALERFLDVAALLSLTGIAMLFVAVSSKVLNTVMLAFSVVVLGLVFLLLVDENLVEKIFQLGPDRIQGLLSDIMSGYRSCSRNDILYNLGLSYVRWILEAAVVFILLNSLSINLGFAAGMVVLGGMSMVSALPISPGGVGPVDAVATSLLMVLGVTYNTALSLVVLQRSLGLVLMALIGTLVYFSEEYFRGYSSSLSRSAS